MDLFYIIGTVIFVLVFIFDRKTLSIKWDKVSTFIGFLITMFLIKAGIDSYRFYTSGHISLPPEHFFSPTYRLTMVWWEDLVFALPIFYTKKFFSKKIWIPVAIISSSLFGLGHIYQGIVAVAVTGLYPYFISNKYGEKHGFGTVMLCNIVYDFAVTIFARFGHNLY